MGTFLRRGHKDRTSPRRIGRAELEAEALRLRRDGHNLDEIARILSPAGTMSEAQVQYMIQTALKRKVDEPADDVKRDELDRLDRLYNRALRIAMKEATDRVPAINAALNVMNRRAALLGLDAPKKVDLNDERSHDLPKTAIADLVARLAKEADQDGTDGGSQVAGGEPRT